MLRAGRETNARIAREIFGYKVWSRGKHMLEETEHGERQLRGYSQEMDWAWKVAEKMNITLIPIEDGQWFAFVGPAAKQGWETPMAMLEFLAQGKFEGCGACLGKDAPLVICEAALNAIEKRNSEQLPNATVSSDTSSHVEVSH